MKSYQYILFDWDGCLARTLDVWLHAYQVALASYGVHPTNHEILQHLGDWDSPRHFGIDKVEECVQLIGDTALPLLEGVELYDHAKDLLDALKPGKRLGLLSSSKRDVLLQGLAHNGLADHFDVILSAEDVTHHKPDPEIIDKAMDILGADKQQCIMIGDSRKDLGAAYNAGVDSVLFYPASHRQFYSLENLKTYHPTYIVKDFQQVTALLN